MTKDASKTKTKTLVAKSPRTKRGNAPADYVDVLADMKRLIADSRHRALATVNRELVCLYWHIGRIIVQQQEHAKWGDAVVEQLAQDLRLAFPDMKGLSRDNVFRMRQFFVSCRDLDRWFATAFASDQKVGPAPRRIPKGGDRPQTATASPRNATYSDGDEKVGALTRQSPSMLAQDLNANIAELVTRLSWTHHYVLIGAVSDPAERYFYLQMSARERWSVRELRRQIDSGLYLRYMSVRRDPEKCLSDDAEQGDLLPFKDHYILEFLVLSDEYSERELRQAILANLRDFFLEFGRDLTFVGEEFAITVGNDTFYIDLLFFQQTHSPRPGTPGRGAGGEGHPQCPLAIGLKIGKFKPEYVGKSQFYCAPMSNPTTAARPGNTRVSAVSQRTEPAVGAIRQPTPQPGSGPPPAATPTVQDTVRLPRGYSPGPLPASPLQKCNRAGTARTRCTRLRPTVPKPLAIASCRSLGWRDHAEASRSLGLRSSTQTVTTPGRCVACKAILQRIEEVIECDFCLFQPTTQRRSLDRPVRRHGNLHRPACNRSFQADMAAALADDHKAKPDQGGDDADVILRGNCRHWPTPFWLQKETRASDTWLIAIWQWGLRREPQEMFGLMRSRKSTSRFNEVRAVDSRQEKSMLFGCFPQGPF